jgi:hypothetical protein
MVRLKKKESVEGILNLHLKTILNWCGNSGLQIAKEKTEIILLTRMKVPRNFSITLTGKVLKTRERIKYLGVVLDSGRKFGDHIELVCTRADAIGGAIRGFLPNVRGPPNVCRKLYYQV